jgi:alpha-mannosidase
LELGKELTFDYALLPHDGDWRDAGTYRAALDFNNPLITRKAAAHTGKLPKRWGLIHLDPPNVVLSAFKPSEQDGAIIRVYEAAGKATSGATIKLNATLDSAWEANLMEDPGSKLESPRDTIRFDLHPFEIKTFKIKLRN